LAALEALGQPQAEVGAGEGVAGAVAEGGADDGPAPQAGRAHGVLAGPLRAAVEVDRVGPVALVVGPGRAVEDEVRRELDEADALRLAEPAERGDGVHVHRPARLLVGLALLDLR